MSSRSWYRSSRVKIASSAASALRSSGSRDSACRQKSIDLSLLPSRSSYDRATLVGQSFGGGVAMQFAYQFPERCERLVLVSSGGLGAEVNMLLLVS